MEEWVKAKNIAEKALNVPLVNKGSVYYRLGIIEEFQQNYEAAIANYKKAILRSLNFEAIEDYKKAINNCEYKISIINTI